MPRYFFNVRSPKTFERDDIGICLLDVGQVRVEAIKGARGLLAEDLRSGRTIDHQQFEVADESGVTILVLRFRDVVDMPT